MKYVIIGAGPAGVTAAEEIRRQDPAAAIIIVCDEPGPPYSRMALPYLIKKKIQESGTHFRVSETHFDDLGIELVNAKVDSIGTAEKRLALSDGTGLDYDKLLIASGGQPLKPPIEGIDLAGVHPCWTLEDARNITARAVQDSSVVLIGAGFISTTIVEALVDCGAKLTIVEMEDRLIPRMMGKEGSDIIRKWCEKKGVAITTSARVERITAAGDKLSVAIAGHDAVTADLVISATGVAPNTGFLEGSGIDTDAGVLVDEYLTTSVPDVYAAGDVAQAPDFLLDEKTVMAIQPVAVEQGRVAGINMVKDNVLCWRGSVNMNVLDMLGLVSCSFGLVEGVDGGDSAQQYHPEHNKFINLQFNDNHLVGASSVGYSEHMGVFQGLIQSRVDLGEWKDRLKQDPGKIMDAWLDCTWGYIPSD
ncbi:MAG: NAD(P)/FAD-dependent oxidoreductase [Gammaproteobacteria bacterium]|nr:NAD(P)/FAD-dependent oxidoreductase [Gammaproteobacteria bacterium]